MLARLGPAAAGAVPEVQRAAAEREEPPAARDGEEAAVLLGAAETVAPAGRRPS
jgi:hypothetical protein